MPIYNLVSIRPLFFSFLLLSLSGCGSSSTQPQESPSDDNPIEKPGTPADSGTTRSLNDPVADNSGSINDRKPVTGLTEHDANTPLNFIIIGDAGTADAVQAALGQTVAQVCENKATADIPGCHFAMATGDNIYFFGAVSTFDPQFEMAFEDIYEEADIPFYLVLGNHDNGFLGAGEVIGDNQVEYSYRPARRSDNWNMPARYYTQRFGTVLELFAVDSDTIDHDLGGLGSGAPYDAQFQRDWLAEALDLSPATWKISFSHYNYISNGNYGDGSSSFKTALEEAVCDRVDRPGVQFHITGHEHDLRWLKPVESCGRTEFIVSGAGGRREDRPATNLGFEERQGENGISDYRDSAGFMWATILGDNLTIEWYGMDPSTPVETFTLTKQELGF